ncbi:hypothetical protein F4861DRAFT_532451 [Xylaria intraflava]|nr:hypothetical protein F4861DRAFT_532451 [Xylaria intraflava]
MASTGDGVAGSGGGKGHEPGDDPSTPIHLDGRQVAASNSTLNAWVGRRRQHSWLINAMPVQPTPRSAQAPVPATATSPTEIASFQPHFQPPSPFQYQLQPQPQSRSQPRPLPQSELQSQLQPEPQAEHEPQPQPQPEPQPQFRPQPQPQPQPQLQPQTHYPVPQLQTSLANTVLPSPAPSDELSPCLSIFRPSPNPGNPFIHSSSKGTPTTEANLILDGEAANTQMYSPRSRGPTSPVGNGPSTVQVGPPPTAPPVEMVLNTPPTPTVATVSNTGVVSRDASQSIPSKRRRIENPYIQFLDSIMATQKLDGYSETVGGGSGPDDTVDRQRYCLLKKACLEGDLFFIALHQLFCLWTTDRTSVHGLCDGNLHTTFKVDIAFDCLESIIRSNSKIKDEVLLWYACFPLPLATLRPVSIYTRALNQALDFLISLSIKWSAVVRDHSLLGYPVLMSELINTLRLYSPTLQTVIFRSSRRSLGVLDRPIGITFDEVFKVDQERHRNPDGTFPRRFEGKAYDEYNKALIRKYQQLIGKLKSAASNMQLNNGTPISPASSVAHIAGIPSPSVAGQPQAEAVGEFWFGPPASTGNVTVPGNQSVVSPSPTFTTVPSATSAVFTPPLPAAVPPTLQKRPTVEMATSPYQSPIVAQQGQQGQQGQYGTSSQPRPQQQPHPQQQFHMHQQRQHQLQVQQLQLQQQQRQRQYQMQQQQQQRPNLEWHPEYGWQPTQQQQIEQRQYDWQQQIQPQQLHRQIQQEQPEPQQPMQQQQQQLGYPHGKQSQPMPTSNFRPPVVQPVPILPSQIRATHQLSPRAQNTNIQPVSTAPVHNPANVPVLPSNVRPNSSPFLLRRETTQTIDRLIPIHGYRIGPQDYPHSPYEKRSVDNSLHQAHLRSPKRILKVHLTTTPWERYYQAACLYEFTFELANEIIEKLSFNERSLGEAIPVNRFSDGSLQIRLRCCNRPITATWPEHMFISLNDQVVELKRKQHHSRDIPADVSSFVRPGINTLSVSILPPRSQRHSHPPHLAVEIVEVLSHSSILQMTREVVQKRLASGLSTDDGLSIDLVDPFVFKIFTVPVRGKACTHLECFDLENWLKTRLGKKSSCACGRRPDCKCPKEPSFVDKWKCPLCNHDARPYSLRIDEFLMEVRNRLEQDNQLLTKSITVFADGSWKANDSVEDDISDNDSDTTSMRAASKSTPKPPALREVIELDDD